MRKIVKQVASLILVFTLGLHLVCVIFAIAHIAQTEGAPSVHGGGPGSRKQPLKQRFLSACEAIPDY